MSDIILGNKELLAIVDALDHLLQASAKQSLSIEDKAMVRRLRQDIGWLIGSHSSYRLDVCDQETSLTTIGPQSGS